MEPGFYECKTCSRRWERMEYKMRKNDPPACPACKAGPEDQITDRQKEDAYVKDVYSPIVKIVMEKAAALQQPEAPKAEVPKCLQPMEKLDFLDSIVEELSVESPTITKESLYPGFKYPPIPYPRRPRY